MNLALPALVILLGLLPGIVFFNAYFAGRFDRRSAGVSGVEELALYVVFAIPLDWLALHVCRGLGIDLSYDVVASLLSGSLTPDVARQVASAMRTNADLVFRTYFAILIGSFAAGAFCRRLVWALRLDTRISALQLRHSWYYLLQGRSSERPRKLLSYVDVLTWHPDGSRLYRGLVVDFELSQTGGILSLVLADTRRGKKRGPDFSWLDIPSDRMTIMGDEIHSINVTYIGLEDEVVGRWNRLMASARRLYRSFVFQEP